MPRQTRPVPTLATVQQPQQSGTAFVEGIVDAWARYLADLLTLRCSFFVRKGGLVRWVGEDAPVYDDTQPRCYSCQAHLSLGYRRVLCPACRREKPLVEMGPTLADVMNRTSHAAYVLDDTKKAVIRTLRGQQELAFDAIVLSNTLRAWCFEAHELAREFPDSETGNVVFDRAFVDNGGSYDRSVLCGLFESPVHVGGLGSELREHVASLAEEWLMSIDALIRSWFDIPVSNDPAEGVAVQRHIQVFSVQIANRVALLEPNATAARAHKSSVLCVDGLEHRAKAQYVNEELHAEAQCQADCESMATLAQLARTGMQTADEWRLLLRPQTRLQVTELLQTPPPELLKLLPTVAQSMRFPTLRDVVGNANEAGRIATQAGIAEWRHDINIEALCLLLERATKSVEAWRQPVGYFVETITRLPRATSEATRVQLRFDPRAALPPTTWARATGEWQLVPRERLALQRTGLRPTGLRIVMLCSALRQLLGTRPDEEPEVFAAGVVACDAMCAVVSRAERAAESAYAELRELMEPLMAGVECAVVKHQLSNWAGSHLEEDVRAAAQNVGRYSLQELTDVFGVDSSHWDGHNLQLVRKVNEQLVFKLQGKGVVGVVSQVLSFALPLLHQYRVDGLGWSITTRGTVPSALLQLLPSVRQWVAQGKEGPLQITRAEVLATSEGVKRLLENLKMARMVRQSRVAIAGKSNLVWFFEPASLAALLAPQEASRHGLQ